MAIGGHVACVGFVADTAAPLDSRVLFAVGATVRAVAVGSRAQFLAMNHVIDVNRIHPVIDRVFSFDDAPDSYRYYASDDALGKVVIRLSPAA